MNDLFGKFIITAHAAGSNTDAVINNIMPKIVDNIVIPIVQLLFALATVYFIYGLYSFFAGSDDTKKTESKNHILYGTIGIAIMISVYGIVRFVANTVGQPSPF